MLVRPRTASLGLLFALVLASCTTASGAPAPGTPGTPEKRFVGALPDTGTFLPDTTVLARVGGRVTRISDFKRGWFNAWQPDLPQPDSAGRAQFLSNMVARDLMALEVQRLGTQLGFEDRSEMREFRERLLSNLLFTRAVLDSVSVTDAEVDRGFEAFRYAVRARHILFDDPDLAAKVRADLVARRIGWEDAVRRYTRDDSTRAAGGSLGWLEYGHASTVEAMEIWPLTPGAISPVFRDDEGFHLAQVLERRPANPPDFNAGRNIVRANLERYRTARRLEALQDIVRRRIHLTYVDENVAWTCRFFTTNAEIRRSGTGSEMTFNDVVPEFAPTDTSRVLATFDGGTLTIGRFLDIYSHIAVTARPPVNSPGLLRKGIDGFLLEPGMAEEAAARGLEQDPLAIRNTAIKREGLLVQRLYQDSVGSHIWVSPKERHAFYEKHLPAYFTFPKVTYAALSFRTKAAADSVAATLRAGTDVNQVLADSTRWGVLNGSIKTRGQNEHGPYQKLLFEELRPGKVAVDGPARDGSWFVVQLLTYDPGHQLTYEQAAAYVDEDTQKIKAEELITAFIARLKQRYPSSSRPDLVMGIHLVERD